MPELILSLQNCFKHKAEVQILDYLNRSRIQEDKPKNDRCGSTQKSAAPSSLCFFGKKGTDLFYWFSSVTLNKSVPFLLKVTFGQARCW
ncbi:MAG: hypothetical protein KDI27_13270, partial [Gammaproteobacteria bacterium]|nr:hypothetical protein [Gammaproteobacteria bacterium]